MTSEIHPLLQQAMFEAVTTTLENMAFMPVELLTEPHDCRNHTQVFRAGLLVKDPLQGELYLVMPEDLLREIASGIYAVATQEVSRPKLVDILNEMLNTIAGLFLTRVLPRHQPFELGLPVINEVACGEIEPMLLQWHFRVDCGHFCLSAGGNAWEQIIPEDNYR